MTSTDSTETTKPALAGVEDLHEVLSRPGARIADIGCGEGWSSIALARAYPEVTLTGIDVDALSVDAARVNAAAEGLADRVEFRLADGAELAEPQTFDAAFIFEALHDMPAPVAVLAAVRAALFAALTTALSLPILVPLLLIAFGAFADLLRAVGEEPPADLAGLTTAIAPLLRGDAVAVVRDGPEGCAVHVAGATTYVPGFPQEPVDTNGAGDTHTGALLAEKGIRHELDVWGDRWPHDWESWRAQLAKHLPRFV